MEFCFFLKSMADHLEDAFGDFLREIDGLAEERRDQPTVELKEPARVFKPDLVSAEYQVDRLTLRLYFSAYDVLGVPPGSDAATIKLQYRRISALVHPDKCKLSKAHEAFLALKEAYDDLQRPDYTDKYSEVISLAKSLVLKRREEENEVRGLEGLDLLETKGPDFDAEVRSECEALLMKQEEDRHRADALRRKNEATLAETRKRANADARESEKRRKIWDKKLDERVSGWRSFSRSGLGGSGGSTLGQMDRGLKK